MKEHDGANYSKEQEDLEKYLMKLIHRYFLMEDDYNSRQEEAIIVEAIRRTKEYLADHGALVFALNDRNGLVHLTPKSMGAEPKFDKNSAYNKDFGTTEDTVCEGNDERLSDAREPLYHTHYIDEFEGLQEELDSRETQLNNKRAHFHDNQSALDVIDYTGDKERYDLIQLENCAMAVSMYLERLESIDNEFTNYINRHKNRLNDILENINNIIEAINTAKDGYGRWYDSAIRYDNDSVDRVKDYFKQKKNTLITLEELERIKNSLSLREIVKDEYDFVPSETTDTVRWYETFDLNLGLDTEIISFENHQS